MRTGCGSRAARAQTSRRLLLYFFLGLSFFPEVSRGRTVGVSDQVRVAPPKPLPAATNQSPGAGSGAAAAPPPAAGTATTESAAAPPLADKASIDEWLTELRELAPPNALETAYAGAFCEGPLVTFTVLAQSCSGARIRIASDGAMSYENPKVKPPLAAGSFCLDPVSSGAEPWAEKTLIAISQSGGDETRKRCGYVEPGKTYAAVDAPQGGTSAKDAARFVSIRIAKSKRRDDFRADIKARAERYLAAANNAQNAQVWPLLQRLLLTPLKDISLPRLYFSGQLPVKDGDSANPLYMLDVKSGKPEKETSLFETQKPLFFVYNLRDKDRVCLKKGKVLDDSALPLAIVEMINKAAGLVSGGSTISRSDGSAPSDETQDPLPFRLFPQGDTGCSFSSLCAPQTPDNCSPLANQRAHFSRLCSLIGSLSEVKTEKDSNGWQTLGRTPFLARLLVKEVERLGAGQGCQAVNSPLEASPVTCQVQENLLRFQKEINRAVRQALLDDVKNQQAESPRTTVVVASPSAMDGGFIYDLKVLRDESGAASCQDSEPTDTGAAKKTAETKPSADGDSASHGGESATGKEREAATPAKPKSVPQVSASRAFAVRSHRPYVSTGTEISVDLPIWPKETPLGGYRFEKVAGISGPDQLYQLLPQSSPQQHVSFAQLVILYPFARCESRWFEGLGLAAGPTFIRASGTGAFTQLNLRVLWEPPFTRGVLVSFGPSLRWLDVPLNYQQGMLVAQPPAAAEPTFAATSRFMVLFSLGVVLDEVVVGKAVAEKLTAGKQTTSKTK